MSYLRLFGDHLLREEEIVGIFDLDSATEMPVSRLFLRCREAEKRLVTASKNIPRSFIVTSDRVYFSHTTSRALLKNLKGS